MRAPLVVVTGTGTAIGKTHTTCALVLALRRVLEADGVTPALVAALKPIESGIGELRGAATEAPVIDSGIPEIHRLGADVEVLASASTFHVKHPPAPYLLARGVSPHLAARSEGRTISAAIVHGYVETIREGGPHVVAVELAGGLFTPLALGLTNADLLRVLDADAVLLVAVDRLGVLHDVAATTRAARDAGIDLFGIVLVTPEHADASTGTNAEELSVITSVPLVAILPRSSAEELADRDDLRALARTVLTPRVIALPP